MNLKFTAIFSIFLLTILTKSLAQDISAIINTYHSVSDIDYCRNVVIASSNDLEIGTDIIIVQIQGANVEARNTSEFGTVTDLGSTGLYEKATIKSINQDSIFLENSLLNTYDLEQQVQIISYPKYENAIVTDVLKAKNWDGITGGILAFQVSNTLTLNAPIDVTGQGFRGGSNPAPQGNCTGGLNNAGRYAYALGDWRGAPKGEGIAVSIGGSEGGRGAIANGGGGGNDHNSGGGGGANITSGGTGGERFTGFLSLACRGNNPGLGGNGIGSQANRVFLGGGGGAGHTNNATANTSNGGNGGGIIIIEANNIVGNNQAIIANGSSANDVNGDGASGGGAGGSIILLSETISGDFIVEAIGGNGGNADNNNNDDCFGPGGGGAGGHLQTNLANLDTNLLGGTSGLTINSSSNCNGGNNNAQDGSTGVSQTISTIPQSDEPVVEPAIINQPVTLDACLNQDIEMVVETKGVGLIFQWQIDRGNGSGFENLVDGINYNGAATNKLTIIDAAPNMSNDQFQLIISTECLGSVVSEPISLNFQGSAPIPNFEYEIQTDGTVIFNNTSELGETFIWDFGDGIMSNMENTAHTYPFEGEYEVKLTVSNDCGVESITKIINIVFAPQAEFNVANTSGCAPLTVEFNNQSTENVTAYEWIFEGGEPATSTAVSPSVVYNQNGLFDVTLIVINEVGTDTLYREDFLNITGKPSAGYIFQTDGLEVAFTNTSVGNNSYTWNFGDGSTNSSEGNPIHTFPTVGVYEVTLTATNDCGENSIIKQVAVGAAPLAVFSVDNNTGCAPVTVQFADKSQGRVDSWQWEFPGGQPETSMEENPTVRYTEAGIYDVILFVTNEVGQDSIKQVGYIQVDVAPLPEFEFEIVEDTVFFKNLSEDADLYGWGFGDGSFSTEENPFHVYQTGGIYYVTLNTYNDFCGAAITIPVNVVISKITQVNATTSVSLFPNPINETLNIDLQTTSNQNSSLRIYSLSGQLITTQKVATKNIQIDMSNYPSGTYWIQLLNTEWTLMEKVIKQ